jgi:hypothetical protein
MHALDGAWRRFQRADAHLAEAQMLIGEFGNTCRNHIVADNDTDPTKPTFSLKTAPDLPLMLPVVISDAIHNLRAALDYIVFELARKDSGKTQDGTQFLIADSKPRFDERSAKYLNGLSVKHVAMIERLQPYMGVDWTKSLREISNPDKHRQLTFLNDSGFYQLKYDGSLSLKAQKPLLINPDDWEVDASCAIFITPPNLSQDGLILTLHRIESGVCRTLELFHAEF